MNFKFLGLLKEKRHTALQNISLKIKKEKKGKQEENKEEIFVEKNITVVARRTFSVPRIRRRRDSPCLEWRHLCYLVLSRLIFRVAPDPHEGTMFSLARISCLRSSVFQNSSGISSPQQSFKDASENGIAYSSGKSRVITGSSRAFAQFL